MMIHNPRDAGKLLWGKFKGIKAYLKKWKNYQINNLNLHLKQVEKENKNPKVSRKKLIIKSDKKY